MLALLPMDAGPASRDVNRFSALASLMGFGWAVVLAVALAFGVIVVARRDRPAAALTIPVLWLEMLLLGLLHRYPFLDQRTSHFLLVLSIAVVAIGVADAAFRLATVRRALGVLFLVAAAGLYFSGVSEYVGEPSIPAEDVRSQVRYIEANRTEGDTILISVLGGWGFAYYWDLDDPVFIDRPLASFRWHSQSKNGSLYRRAAWETYQTARRHAQPDERIDLLYHFAHVIALSTLYPFL